METRFQCLNYQRYHRFTSVSSLQSNHYKNFWFPAKLRTFTSPNGQKPTILEWKYANMRRLQETVISVIHVIHVILQEKLSNWPSLVGPRLGIAGPCWVLHLLHVFAMPVKPRPLAQIGWDNLLSDGMQRWRNYGIYDILSWWHIQDIYRLHVQLPVRIVNEWLISWCDATWKKCVTKSDMTVYLTYMSVLLFPTWYKYMISNY